MGHTLAKAGAEPPQSECQQPARMKYAEYQHQAEHAKQQSVVKVANPVAHDVAKNVLSRI